MSKIKYTFYDEKNDTNSVVDLMKRNQFGLAKFDSNLTVEKFIDYQQKKGTIFAVVGKKDGEIISYVAAYRTGAQCVMKDNQVYVGRLIIDKKYRMNLFSVKDMFALVIEELVDRGYNDFICKIKKENIASFYMMRKLGFVIIDEKQTLFDFYVLHNYLMSVGKLFNQKNYINRNNLAYSMQKLDKHQLYRSEKIINQRFIHMDSKSSKRNYFICVDIRSGNIAGLYLKDMKIKIWPEDSDFKSYCFENSNSILRQCTIEFVNKKKERSIKEMSSFQESFALAEDIETMTLKIAGDMDTYTFRIAEMRQFSNINPSSSISFAPFTFEKDSGFLAIAPYFKEMWPHVCAPYMEGIVEPNRKKKLNIETKDQSLLIKEEKEDYFLLRQYIFNQNQIEIKTVVTNVSDGKIQPMFQFALYDLSYDLNIYLEDGTMANRRYDPEERSSVNDELIFVDFMQKDYSKKKVERIEMIFQSNPKIKYRIRFQKAVRCFCQVNYLGIIYDETVYKNKKEIDFGSILIEQINY